MTRIRIGNIEYRESRFLDGTGTYEEIVRWLSNGYYGKYDMMLNDGWRKTSDGSLSRGNTTIDSSCFIHQESCISIATILWNNSHDEFDVKSVGLRAFELKENDQRDFLRVLKLIGETNA